MILYYTIKARTPEKKLSDATHCFYNRYTALWNINISCRHHLPDTQQKPTQRKNSGSFGLQAQTWKIEPDEVQVSYDVTKLYPSLPINKKIDVILQLLSEDYEDLKTRTKLTLVKVPQLIEFCVIECYILWDNVIWNLLNSGPVGLSIMIVLSESYLHNLEKNAIKLSLKFAIASKTFRQYLDDSHDQFGSRNN